MHVIQSTVPMKRQNVQIYYWPFFHYCHRLHQVPQTHRHIHWFSFSGVALNFAVSFTREPLEIFGDFCYRRSDALTVARPMETVQ